RRLALLVPMLAVSVLLSGCWAPGTSPGPLIEQTIPQEVDVAAVEETMLAILPGVDAGLEISDETGIGNPSFGSDWSEVDHDATRGAAVSRGLTAAGWADASGPGFYAVFEVVGRESVVDADGAAHEISTVAREPYALPAEAGCPTPEYEVVRAPNHP